MFAPSFFTGSLIKRFGVLNVMLAGVVLNFVCIGIALAGIDVANFWPRSSCSAWGGTSSTSARPRC